MLCLQDCEGVDVVREGFEGLLVECDARLVVGELVVQLRDAVSVGYDVDYRVGGSVDVGVSGCLLGFGLGVW